MNLPASQPAGRFCGSLSPWIPRPFRPERIHGPEQPNDYSSKPHNRPTADRHDLRCSSARSERMHPRPGASLTSQLTAVEAPLHSHPTPSSATPTGYPPEMSSVLVTRAGPPEGDVRRGAPRRRLHLRWQSPGRCRPRSQSGSGCRRTGGRSPLLQLPRERSRSFAGRVRGRRGCGR